MLDFASAAALLAKNNPNAALITALVIGGVVLFIGAIFVLAYFSAKKREKALADIAAALQFEFLPAGDTAELADLGGFWLMSQGRSNAHYNLLRARSPNLRVAVLDYNYTVRAGKNNQVISTTVVVLRFTGPALPHFTVSPENIFHRIGSAMGYQDIDFADDPEFSKKYLLRGQEEDAIRAAFTPDVRRYYSQLKGVSTEGGGNTLLHYRLGKHAKPANLKEFLEESYRVLALFIQGMQAPGGR